MFSYITGVVEHIDESSLILECNGIGYKLLVPGSTIGHVAHKGQAKIYTVFSAGENGVFLYGFASEEERGLFELLTSVTGVGPKAALSLLTALTPSQLALAIVTEDDKALSRANGIGKKTAQRISLELKDKIRGYDSAADMAVNPQQIIGAAGGGPKQDAIEALVSLGYGRSEAVRAVLEVALPEMEADKIIKAALKKLL